MLNKYLLYKQLFWDDGLTFLLYRVVGKRQDRRKYYKGGILTGGRNNITNLVNTKTHFIFLPIDYVLYTRTLDTKTNDQIPDHWLDIHRSSGMLIHKPISPTLCVYMPVYGSLLHDPLASISIFMIWMNIVNWSSCSVSLLRSKVGPQGICYFYEPESPSFIY